MPISYTYSVSGQEAIPFTSGISLAGYTWFAVILSLKETETVCQYIYFPSLLLGIFTTVPMDTTSCGGLHSTFTSTMH